MNVRVIGNRVLVEKVEEEKKADGFETVETQDNFIYKGKVAVVGGAHVTSKVGDTIIFAKYSPDTHEIDIEGVKYKFVAGEDILAVV